MFYVASAVIILVLIRIRQSNLDSVGYAFMFLTCVKMVFAYLLLHPILESDHLHVAAEKANSFGIFLLFLIIETSVTARMLNKP